MSKSELAPEFQSLLNEFNESIQEYLDGLPALLDAASSTPHAAASLLSAFCRIGGSLFASLFPVVIGHLETLAAAAENDPDAAAVFQHQADVFRPLQSNAMAELSLMFHTMAAVVGFFDRITVEPENASIILPATATLIPPETAQA